MKLISSSPKSQHHRRNGPQRGWFLKRLRSRFLTSRFIISVAWLLFVLIVGTFAISCFHLLRQAMETVAGQE